MQCKYFVKTLGAQCDKEAAGSFACCGVTHGVHFKQNVTWMKNYKDLKVSFNDFYYNMGMKLWTLVEAEYYSNLIR